MEKLEQYSFPQRVGDTLRNGLEYVRGAAPYAAVLLTSATALLAPEVVAADSNAVPQRPAPTFKPGNYEGTTSQTCPTPAAKASLCVEGEKIPLSFTATKDKITDFHTAATTICYAGADKLGKGTFSVDVKQANLNNKHIFSVAQLKDPGTAQTAANGRLHGAKAEGDIGFAVHLNDEGEISNDDSTYCQTDIITWQAQRVP